MICGICEQATSVRGDKKFSTFKIHECIHLSAGWSNSNGMASQKDYNLNFSMQILSDGSRRRKRNMENGKKIIFHLLIFFFSRTKHMVEFGAEKVELATEKCSEVMSNSIQADGRRILLRKFTYPSNIFSNPSWYLFRMTFFIFHSLFHLFLFPFSNSSFANPIYFTSNKLSQKS